MYGQINLASRMQCCMHQQINAHDNEIHDTGFVAASKFA